MSLKLILYILASVVLGLSCLTLGILVLRKKDRNAPLGVCMITGFVTVTCYTVSLFLPYFLFSLLSSIYFCSIDIILLSFLTYLDVFTRRKPTRLYLFHVIGLCVLAAVDCLLLMINPFKEVALTYTDTANSVQHWRYHPYFPYHMHLWITYAMSALAILRILTKVIRVPAVFRSRYTIILGFFLLILLVNALYLFLPGDDLLDFSLLMYPLMGVFMYWNSYHYSQRGLMNAAQSMVLESLSNPVVLFDYEDRYVTNNPAANFLISRELRDDSLLLKRFLAGSGMMALLPDTKQTAHFRYVYRGAGNDVVYSGEYRRLRDEKNRFLGTLIVLTDNSLETDLLTGFRTRDSFRRESKRMQEQIAYPAAVAVCDLNRLTDINNRLGRDVGDQALQSLATTMTQVFPEGTQFVRLADANLVAICGKTGNRQMHEYTTRLARELQEISLPDGTVLGCQCAVVVATQAEPDLVEAAARARNSMRTRKMLDSDSAHSSLLNSLAQALEESDNTTRAHVVRTHAAGQALGNRLWLDDLQQSHLALLCLLHDIGKLGVPLEILNKTGRLARDEWDIMRSHAQKGYNICMASPELRDIADMVLHHHEAWDGSGYPDGLRGESIPLLSRIIAVIDAYDAMTNDRPYRRAISHREAQEELRRCAGNQFDPNIVNEYLTLLKENPPEMPAAPAASSSDASGPMTDDAPRSYESLQQMCVFPVNYGIYHLDETQTIIDCNKIFTDITGYTEADLKEHPITQMDLVPVEDQKDYWGVVTSILSVSNIIYLEHRLRRKDGMILYVFCYGRIDTDPATGKPISEIIVVDMSETLSVQAITSSLDNSRRRVTNVLEEKLRHDPLTGLLNHSGFQNEIQLLLLNSDELILMVMIDLDHFKQYNDTLGHAYGDRLLQHLGKAMGKALPENGLGCRMGGDEFAFALSFPADTPQETLAARLHQCWESLCDAMRTYDSSVTLSGGAALAVGQTGCSFKSLYTLADKELYAAKSAGRNQLMEELEHPAE